MSQIMSVVFMMVNSLLFSSMNHPMNMGLTLLMQTLMMSILMGLMSYSSWFSYILFLVFLGGMLVLFIYMTSIASNEVFKKSLYFMMPFMTLIFLWTFMFMMADSFMISNPIFDQMDNLFKLKMIMSPLYNKPSSMITIFMVMYLFLTLIVIVYITKFNKGPLRPMN